MKYALIILTIVVIMFGGYILYTRKSAAASKPADQPAADAPAQPDAPLLMVASTAQSAPRPKEIMSSMTPVTADVVPMTVAASVASAASPTKASTALVVIKQPNDTGDPTEPVVMVKQPIKIMLAAPQTVMAETTPKTGATAISKPPMKSITSKI